MLRVTIFFLFCAAITTFAQPENASRKRNFNHENSVALREFDPVSFFSGRPAKGSAKFEYNYKGIFYYFVNAANREEFIKTPAKYEPMYGGWCAYTLSQKAERVKIQPNSFKIIDNKLFLFYNFSNENRMLLWNRGDEQKLIAAAEKNWIRTMH
jgi:YHS domain-containing protein